MLLLFFEVWAFTLLLICTIFSGTTLAFFVLLLLFYQFIKALIISSKVEVKIPFYSWIINSISANTNEASR